MSVYDLFLESGPQHKRTLVHVPQLLGCCCSGATTDEALAAAPAAIRAFLQFMAETGERARSAAAVSTRVAEHQVRSGPSFFGHGSPYLTIPIDLAPLTQPEARRLALRFARLAERLAGWADEQTPRRLDAKPASGGRSARQVLEHTLASPGDYLSAGFGGAPGFSGVLRRVERRELSAAEALRTVAGLVQQRIDAATTTELRAVRSLSGGERTYTVHKSLRRCLEHTWEHLSELSRRPGGPRL